MALITLKKFKTTTSVRRTKARLLALATVLLFSASACETSTVDGAGGGTGSSGSGPVASGSPSVPGTVIPDGVSGNPSAPNTLLAFAGNASVRLVWTPPSKNGPFKYAIYRKLQSGGSYARLVEGLDTTTYTDLTSLNGVGYTYRMRAVADNGGTTSDSNEESAQPIAMFSILSLSQNPANNEVTVAWAPATGATSYDIVTGTAGDYNTVLAANVTSPAVLTGLATGASHPIQIIARNSVGRGAEVRSATVMRASLMSGAFNFALKNVSSGIQVSWAPVTGADHYKIFYGTSPGAYVESGIVTVTQSPFTITGVTGPNTYFVMVYAYGQSLQYAAGGEKSIYVGTPSTKSWTFDSGSESSYATSNSWSTINFTSGGMAQLLFSDTQDLDNSASGFGGGTKTGVDWSTNSLRLANVGGCDATQTHCTELDRSWAPQWSNLVLYAKFKSTDVLTNGTTFTPDINTTGGGYTVTNTGNLTLKTSSKARYGLTNGGGGYIGGGVSNAGTAFTYSAWIKPSNALINSWSSVSASGTAGCNSGMGVLGGFNAGSTDAAVELAVGTNGVSVSEHAAGWAPVVFASALSLSGWHHVALRAVSGTQLEVYLDGRLLGTALNTAKTRRFGINYIFSKGACSQQNFVGESDEFAVWNVALTPAEILRIYQRQGAARSGTFYSRVFSAALAVPWIKWVTTLPYGKELPSTAESPADYPAVLTTLNTGLLGLWHFNEPSTATGAGAIKDASVNANHGTLQNGAVAGANGRFNTSVYVNAGGKVNMGTAATLKVTDAFTASAWIFPTGNGSDATYGGVIVNREGEYELVRYPDGRLWIALANTSPGWNVTAITGGTAPLYKWSHVVWTYDRNAASNQINVYIDGVLAQARAGSGVIGDAATTMNEFWIGARQGGGQTFSGMIDEVGMWGRALTATEVSQLYRRGANRLSIQLRNCSAANCSDDPNGLNWKGYDNSSSTLFTELNNNSTPVSMLGNILTAGVNYVFSAFGMSDFSGPYLQYRAIFESDDTTSSPDLVKVALKGGYDSSAPWISTNAGMPYSALLTFNELLGAGCLTGVKYNLSNDQTNWYYWDGAAWSLANGTVTQANTASSVSSKISEFAAMTGPSTLYVKAFLTSNGSSKCELDAISVQGRN